MKRIAESDLLAAWERGIDRPLIEKNLHFLTVVYPEMSPSELWSMPIGDRDARLLNLRERLFGSTLRNAGVCPECNLKIEWEVALNILKLQPIQTDNLFQPILVKFNGGQVTFRRLNSLDLLDLSTYSDREKGINTLIRKCIIQSDIDISTEQIPKNLKDSIIQKMEEADPQADIRMEVSCPDCFHQWSMTFDILEYLWVEINDWARRMIRDIGLLARYFGWSEKEILELSGFRRQLYLNMIKG